MPEACAGPRTAHAREPAPLSSLLPALRPLCGSPPPHLAGWAQPGPPAPAFRTSSGRTRTTAAEAQPPRPARGPRAPAPPRAAAGARRDRPGVVPAAPPRPAPCPPGSRVLTARRSRPGRRLPVHMAPALRARARGRGSPAPRFPQGAPAPRPRPGSPPAPAPRSRGCSGASPRRAGLGAGRTGRGMAARGVNESRA